MKRIFTLLLTLILLSNLIVIPASAAEDNSIYIPKIVGTDNGNKLVFVPELARVAREMSADAYGIKKGSKAKDIAKTFVREGFTNIQQSTSFWDDALTSSFSNNFLVGVKTFEVDGQKKHILAIAFRGTDDAIDVVTDLTYKDTNGYHSGFHAAAVEAYDSLEDMKFDSLKNENGKSMSFVEYLHQCILTDDYYILVTGHSLGGAVANIFTGEMLPNSGVRDAAMCYTFASPKTCSQSKARQKNSYNIFNIINTEDTVPKIGYDITKGGRLGVDLKAEVSTGSILNNHKINITYSIATTQIINDIDSQYKYTIPFYNRWCEEVLGGQDNNSGGTQKENNNNGASVGTLGTCISGVVDIPSSWENLSIRSGPSTNYQIVGSMNDGVRCNVYPSKTQNGWYYVEYNGIYGYASGNYINTGNSSGTPKPSNPTPTVKPSTPAGISISTSNVNLNYPNSPTQTITVTATGDLPNTYKFELDIDGYVSFNWGTWSGNSINLTLTAHDGSNSCTPKIYLKDSDTGDVRASISFNVSVTKPAVKEYITVSFDSNGGSTDYASQTVEKYGTATIPSKKPSKSGYEFLGWSTYRDVSKASYKSGETINVGNTDLTFYAIWSEEEASWDEWDLSLSEKKLYFNASDSKKVILVKLLEHNGKKEGVDYDLKITKDDYLAYEWGDSWYDEDGYRCTELEIYNPKKKLDKQQVSVLLRDEDGYVASSKNFSVIYEEKQAVQFADRNQTGISVYLNGKKLTFDVQPQIINGRTMVPMRKIFEELGTVVGWNNNTRTAVAVRKGDVIRIGIGGQYMTCNGEQKMLDSPAVVISGRTLVPVRAIAESLNCDVEWYDYGANQVVDINMKDTVNKMENIGGLLIGWCEYAPFSYLDDDGTLIGFDTELAEYVCKFWGWNVTFTEIPFDQKFTAIKSGRIDCYWNGITKTEEREELCTFTNDYVSFDMQYEEDGEWYTSHETYSVPFRKGDYDTVQLVNIALEEAKKDGTIEHLKFKYGIE